jgi:hypothetical protein
MWDIKYKISFTPQNPIEKCLEFLGPWIQVSEALKNFTQIYLSEKPG